QSAADQAGLPDGGPSRYRDQMRATRDLIRAQVDNPAFSAEDVAFLDVLVARFNELDEDWDRLARADPNRKSTRLNSSHVSSSYAVCCLKKKARAVRVTARA